MFILEPFKRTPASTEDLYLPWMESQLVFTARYHGDFSSGTGGPGWCGTTTSHSQGGTS